METLYFSITLFAIGAVIGIYLLSLVLSKKMTSKFLTAIHGIFVATALILLIYYAFQHGQVLTESIILFVIATLGGITLLIHDIIGKSFPRWLAIVHGLIAVGGFIYLLVYTFTN